MQTCDSCEYFDEARRRVVDGVVFGACRRYPVPAVVHSTDWCGEYRPDAERGQAMPSYVDDDVDVFRAD